MPWPSAPSAACPIRLSGITVRVTAGGVEIGTINVVRNDDPASIEAGHLRLRRLRRPELSRSRYP